MIRRSLVMLAFIVILGGCTESGLTGITVVTDGDHSIEAGTRVLGTVAVGAGSLTVEDGAAIEGDVYVGDGVLTLAGSVGGNVAAIGGAVRLTPTGHVGGRVQIGAGGTLVEAPGSRVDGGVERGVAIPDAARAPGSPMRTRRGRLRDPRCWSCCCWRSVSSPPVGSGQLAGICPTCLPPAPHTGSWSRWSAVLFVLMAFTIILIPVSLLGLVALGLGACLGLAAALDAVARRIGAIAASGAFVVAAAILPSLPASGPY